jgi:hypothetical protein
MVSTYNTDRPLLAETFVVCLRCVYLLININVYSALKSQIKKLEIIGVLIKNGKDNSNRHQKSYLAYAHLFSRHRTFQEG